MNIDMIDLGLEVREMGCIIESMSLTPLTHPLTLQLLDTYTKSGNMGCTISLLNLQKSRDCLP